MEARIFSRLNFEMAKSRRPDLLKKLDRFVMGSNARSLLDMDVDEANKVISHKMDECMKQDDVLGDFLYFAERFSEGTVTIDYADTVKMMVSKIMENRDVIKKNIQKLQ